MENTVSQLFLNYIFTKIKSFAGRTATTLFRAARDTRCKPQLFRMHRINVSISDKHGTSVHYTGEKGEKYFDWQRSAAAFRGKINSHKFQHHINASDTVVDFGCGAGGLLSVLNAKRKIGIEINVAAQQSIENFAAEYYATT
ncbi:hypothetical protein N9M41_07080, partial [Rhodopirellula sp.]|nr:hypothetical protein [Rhodopirellula sp.]